MAVKRRSSGEKKSSTTTKKKFGLNTDMLNKMKSQGAGTAALIPDNIDEQIATNPEGLIKELSSHFAMIPIEQIEANPDQPRREFEETPLEELSESIKIHGIIQPITVRRFANKQYQIISGERRFRASKIAGLQEIPAFIRIANDQTLMEMALIENIQREDLNPIDIANGYHRLKEEFQLTDEQLAERVGKNRTTVTNYRRLLELHPAVITAVRSQEISMGHAKEIAGVTDKLLQNEFLKEIIAKGLSVRATERLGKKYKGEKNNAPKRKTASSNLSVEHQKVLEDFQSFFEYKQIKMEMESEEKGQIVIKFNSNDQLHYLFKCIEQQ